MSFFEKSKNMFFKSVEAYFTPIDFLWFVWRDKWSILFFVFFGSLLSVLYSVQTPETYEVRGAFVSKIKHLPLHHQVEHMRRTDLSATAVAYKRIVAKTKDNISFNFDINKFGGASVIIVYRSNNDIEILDRIREVAVELINQGSLSYMIALHDRKEFLNRFVKNAKAVYWKEAMSALSDTSIGLKELRRKGSLGEFKFGVVRKVAPRLARMAVFGALLGFIVAAGFSLLKSWSNDNRRVKKLESVD